MAGKGGAIRAGKAYYELGGQTNPLKDALKKAEGMIRKSVAMIGGALAAAGGTAAIAAMVKNWASAGNELVNAGKRANVSAAALGSLGYAAKQTGSDVGQMEGALKGIRDKTMEAARGSDQAQLAFARLGINFLALSRLKPDDQLRLIAKRLNSIPNPALRAAAATELLGSADLLPTLERLREFENRAKRLGIVMSNEDAKAAQKFDQALTDLWEITKSFGNTVAAKIAPALEWCVNLFADMTRKVRDWGKASQDIGKLVQLAWAEAGQRIADEWDRTLTAMVSATQKAFGLLGMVSPKLLIEKDEDLEQKLQDRMAARAAAVQKLRDSMSGKANGKGDGKGGPGNIAAAAAGGISQAMLTLKSPGAQDVRTKEGFQSVAASLRQQSLQQEQLYYTRRMVIALEKLGVLSP